MKLAHLTDLHLRHHTPGLAPNSPARFREAYPAFLQALEQIKNMGVDRLILSGDIVDAPGAVLNPTDYYMDLRPTFLPLVEKDYRLVRDALEATEIPYTIIPGNHDHYPTFFSVFPEAGKTAEQGGYRFVSYADREWAANTPRRHDRERKRMVAELSDADSPPQIHVQHFLPHPILDEGYPFNYYDAENITRSYADSAKVILSLSGHYHPGTELIEANGVTYATGEGFCEEPFPYRVYTLDENAIRMERFETTTTPIHADKPLAILDRDGVINTLSSYTTGPEEMKLIPGAGPAIRRLKEAGYVVLINTNQSCVGLGEVPRDIVDLNHDWLCHLLREEAGADAHPDMLCYSVQAGEAAVTPDFAGSDTVKPATTLIDRAVERHGLNKTESWMVGDRMGDMEFARRFGARPILVRTGDGKSTLERPDFQAMGNSHICENLHEAVERITTSS